MVRRDSVLGPNRARNVHPVRHAVENGFEWWGARVVVRHPRKLMVATCLGALVLGAGVLRLKTETKSEKLWTPQRSVSQDYKAYQDATYGSGAGFAVAYVTAHGGGNALTYPVLSAALKVHTYTTTGVGNWSAVCRTNPGQETCTNQNLLSLWGYNETTLQQADAAGTIGAQLAWFDTHYSSFRNFAASPVYDAGGTLLNATAISLYYALRPEDASAEGAGDDFLKAWNSGMGDLQLGGAAKVSYFSTKSFDDELQRVVNNDITLYIIALVLMTCWLCATIGACDAVRSRTLLGQLAIVQVLLGVIAGFGVAALLGVPFSSIVTMVPLIALGVQVDDVIIGVNTLDMTAGGSADERFVKSLRSSGPAITITSLSSVCAFAIGTVSDLPGVQFFCAYAALVFFFAYVANITFFYGALLLDERRKERGALSLAPCITRPERASKPAEGAVPETRFKSFLRSRFAPCLLHPAVSVLVVVVFASMAAASIAASASPDSPMKLGLPEKDLMPDDSYVLDAFAVEEHVFGGRISSVSILIRDTRLDDAANRAKVRAALTQLVALPEISGLQGDWMAAYEAAYPAVAASANYTSHLAPFLLAERRYQANVACDVMGGRGPAATACEADVPNRFFLTMQMGGDSKVTVTQRKRIDGVLASNGLSHCMAFMMSFLFAESDTKIWDFVLTNMGVAIAAILAIMLLFTRPLVSVCSAACVASICADLFGFMSEPRGLERPG